MEEREFQSSMSESSERSGRPSFIRGAFSYVAELLRIVLISLAIIIPIRYFLAQPFYVKGASMEPNFYDHEYLIIDEISYRLREPRRGEIVVFRYPKDPTQFFIKRVIGLPGETVRVQAGKVLVVNSDHPEGILLDEPYLEHAETNLEGDPVALGDEEYYLLGDNRDSSLDSRRFGSVSRELIVGRAWLRGWPIDRIMHFGTPTYLMDGAKP